MLLAALAAVLLLAAAIVGIAFAVGGGGGGGDGTCTRETFPDQGRAHITARQKPPRDFEYNSFPATSGWHNPSPAIWNVYEQPVDQQMLVHNLEHGGVVVQYGEGVSQETVAEIVEWYRDDPNGIVVAPLPDSPQAEELRGKIALTAWRNLAICSSFDEEAFSDFRDDFRGEGPERFPVEALEPGT